MQFHQLAHGEFLTAEYYRFNPKTKEYFPSKQFNYKTYDDAQLYERRTSLQGGNLSSKFSVSIKTTVNLPFKTKDKIRTINDGREYYITGVQYLQNTPLTILNVLSSKIKGTVPIILHLNKDDV